METDNQFFVNIIGQIEHCAFPYRSGSSTLFCRYELSAGADWQSVSGVTNGVTQSAEQDARGQTVFNMPIEAMFKSTNPYGWPQMTLSFFGRNWWGTETVRGYARLHVPLGKCRTIRAPIVSAKCSNVWAALQSWLTDRDPELKNPKVLTEGHRTKGLLFESFGEVVVSLQTITRGTERMALDWGQSR